MSPKPAPDQPVKTVCLNSRRGEKISAVEGLTLTPRMRALLEMSKGRPAEERLRLIQAQFAPKSS